MTPALHADASQVLSEWHAPDEQQEQLRRDYLAYLSQHPDAMERSCRPGHLTASALVLDAEGRVLLTLHARLGRWLQTGGHCEPTDATLAGAALREAAEESGIEDLSVGAGPLRLDRHLVPCAGPETEIAHLDVQYLARAAAGAREQRSEESIDLRWFDVDRLPPQTDESVRALVRAAR